MSCLGIDPHHSRQLGAQTIQMNRLWFYNYLKDEAINNCNEIQVAAYLVFTRRSESLNDDFVDSNIWRYHENKYGGTHLVQEVDYGAEFILWMRKPVDPSKETKDSVEKTMNFELNHYLENFFDNDTTSPPSTLNEMFDTMICSFEGSIGNGCVSNVTFEQGLRMIRELTDTEVNDRQNIWRPVRMEILRIPTKVEIQVAIDTYEEIVLNFKRDHQRLTKECQHLIESPYLHRVPFLKKPLVVVQKLLEKIASDFNKTIDDLQDKQYSPKYQIITDLYTDTITKAITWLARYHEDVKNVAFLLEGNNLQVLDLRSINKPVKEVGDDVKRTHVFVLYFTCITTNHDTCLEESAKNPEEDLCECDFEISSEEPNVTWKNICKEWQGFLNEANHSAGKDIDYAVGILSPSSPYREGMVVTIGNDEILRTVTNVNRTQSNGTFPHFRHISSAGVRKRFKQDSDDDNRSSNF